MTKLAQEINKLRNKGLSYKEIVKILGCSISMLSYYCSITGKDNVQRRTERYRRENPLLAKLYLFRYRRRKHGPRKHVRKTRRDFCKEKIRDFQRRINDGKLKMTAKANKTFSDKELRAKLGDIPKCYLTGDCINLDKPDTYNLDHRIPFSRGGDNSLNNCEITSAVANAMKGDLFETELFEMCKKILEYNGYKVTKVVDRPDEEIGLNPTAPQGVTGS